MRIKSNAENVTKNRKGKYGWISQYRQGISSKSDSYFHADQLVPILTARESGNLLMTPVFHSTSSKHLLLLHSDFSVVKLPNSLKLYQTTYLSLTPNSLKLYQTTYLSLNSKLPQSVPNYLSLFTPNSLSFGCPRVLQEAASSKLPQVSTNHLSHFGTKLHSVRMPSSATGSSKLQTPSSLYKPPFPV